jgi:hypothetical protein
MLLSARAGHIEADVVHGDVAAEADRQVARRQDGRVRRRYLAPSNDPSADLRRGFLPSMVGYRLF